jgi:hypothetical protein
MADTRKFVLPGQPPGTARSSCLLLLRGWGFARSPRESTENSMVLRPQMRFRFKTERKATARAVSIEDESS